MVQQILAQGWPGAGGVGFGRGSVGPGDGWGGLVRLHEFGKVDDRLWRNRADNISSSIIPRFMIAPYLDAHYGG